MKPRNYTNYWLFGAAVAAVLVVTLNVTLAYAQSRGGGGGNFINSSGYRGMFEGVGFAIWFASVSLPALILGYYTWKMRPKDVYEAAWLAIAWCAWAYVLR